jgi:hypothetical protein
MLRDAVLQSPAAGKAVERATPATQANWTAALRDARLTTVAPAPAVMRPLEVGIDRPGGDLQPGFQVPGAEQCSAQCAARGDCRAMTFVKHAAAEGGICWLKGSVPAGIPARGVTSAIKQ